MPEVHVYVSERTRGLIAALPPDVSVSQLLRELLESRQGCPHDLTMVRCVRCGATVESGDGDIDIPPSLEEPQVEDVAVGSPGDGGTLDTP